MRRAAPCLRLGRLAAHCRQTAGAEALSADGVQSRLACHASAQDEPFLARQAMTAELCGLVGSGPEALRQWEHRHVLVELGTSGATYPDAFRDTAGAHSHGYGDMRQYSADVPMTLADLLQHIQNRNAGHDSRCTAYLAQKDVEDMLPELAACLPAAPPRPGMASRTYRRCVWLGPAGTVTPLHCDPNFNMLVQLFGVKHVRLYNPVHVPRLYPFTHPRVLRNTSQVDVAAVDAARFPLFADTPFVEFTLGPGDLLYIPYKWWHYVCAASASLTISYWW